MPYPYEDLDDSQFERLVVQCGKKLFGAGLQGFSPGRDGGRDARFHGTAERHPSTASPWKGISIVQAKHTSGTNTHFSDPAFSVNKTSVLAEELPRIKALVTAGEADNYMLIANRRLGGVTGPKLINAISDATGLPKQSVFIGGIEFLEDQLTEYPELIQLAKLETFERPLLVSSQDLAEVILAISDEVVEDPDVTDAPVASRTSFKKKNTLNNMSDEFAEVLSDRYMVHTSRIDAFLADPANGEVLSRYQDAVDEFQLKIVAKRNSFEKFDDVFNHIIDLLISRDAVLSRNKALTRTMLFYMYWHCDLGDSERA